MFSILGTLYIGPVRVLGYFSIRFKPFKLFFLVPLNTGPLESQPLVLNKVLVTNYRITIQTVYDIYNIFNLIY